MEQQPQPIGIVWVDARHALVATAPDGEATLTREPEVRCSLERLA